MSDRREVGYCCVCPFFDGFGAVGVSNRLVICRLTKPDLINMMLGEAHPESCPLPVLVTKKKQPPSI